MNAVYHIHYSWNYCSLNVCKSVTEFKIADAVKKTLCLTDIDECHIRQHSCKVGKCLNTIGSYTCVSEPETVCPAGYKPSSNMGKQCEGKM
jgi:hypothetical protein